MAAVAQSDSGDFEIVDQWPMRRHRPLHVSSRDQAPVINFRGRHCDSLH